MNARAAGKRSPWNPCRWLGALSRWAIRKAYFRWCFRRDEWLEQYCIEFVPSDLRSLNPHVAVMRLNEKTKRWGLEASWSLIGDPDLQRHRIVLHGKGGGTQ